MNSLVELKNTFRQNRVPISESGGWYFTCCGDKWTMLDGAYFLNNTKMDKKTIASYIEMNKARKAAKKIKANIEEEEYASESN
jgi:hypothetical protein